ncbi:MAG TPA: DUF2851 family protein [Sphingobacteriaceae bacterium]
MPFPEDFLHYLWKFRLFNQSALLTIGGEELKILNVGRHNKNAGPDFENAQIRIGDTLWAGSVEIHINSSDWQKHHHDRDAAYENVILHVVYHHDQDQFRRDGSQIPVLELKELIPEGLSTRYQELMLNMNWIACQAKIATVDPLHTSNWLSRVLVERLEEKSKAVQSLLEEFKGSWDDAFYVILARNFGFKLNAVPFEMLARSLSRQILDRHKSNPLQIEALIFGQAGFLHDTFVEQYPNQLRSEYVFLKNKYELEPLDRYLWKFLRSRPQNFPTVRLAQFAALINRSSRLFSKVLEARDSGVLMELFSNLPVHPYWTDHYRFGVTSKPYPHQMGTTSVQNILINTVALFLFMYGRNMGRNSFVNKAVHLLESLPLEHNQVIERFKETGIEMKGAFSSQALLQLKKAYCDEKQCLNCGIGTKLLSL